MAFHDMAGVFYAILFGLFVSLLVLLGELAWEAYKDVKESKVNSCLDFEHSLQQLTIPHIWQFSYCGSVDQIWSLGSSVAVVLWLVLLGTLSSS